MSAKRVRLITLIGIIMMTLVIGISIILTYALGSLREDPLPDTQTTVSAGTETADATAGDGLERVEVTTDTVQDVIASLKRAETYSRYIKIENFFTRGSTVASAVYEIEVSVIGKASAVKISSANINKNIIITDASLYIWFDGDTTTYNGVPGNLEDNSRTADEYQMIMKYEDILEQEQSTIILAEYTKYEGQSCIYVEYIAGLLKYTTKCYISVENGLLVGAEQYDGTTLVYRMTTSGYSAERPAQTAFDLPGNRNALSVP